MGFDLDDYVSVNERLAAFRGEYQLGITLRSEILVADADRVLIHAWAETLDGVVLADGHAEEVRGSTPVNRTSALENCETSAWGRVLANMGYEVKRAVASREEVERAQAAERALKATHAIAEAADRAGMLAKAGMDAKEKADRDKARRAVLQAVCGVRSVKDMSEEDYGKVVRAFADIADGKFELRYDTVGNPFLLKLKAS